MIKDDKALDVNVSATEQPHEADREDPLASTDSLLSQEIPRGVDRRTFLMRSAVGGAAAVMTGSIVSAHERTEKAVATLPVLRQQPNPTPPLDPKLNVVQKGQRARFDDRG